ncbi:YSC84-related protein [Chitinibacter sp. SCUT-21]|uniref:YSC84-related protein n=1 Tax=Chitinibacter sp. SCUT-21 TaxID=2970891 RepID=UPI0035A71CFB
MLLRQCVIAVAAVTLSMPVWAEGNATNKSHETQQQKTPTQRRADIDKNIQQSLAMVYKKYPDAKAQIAKAAGYAVFKTGGFTAVFLGAGGGEGVAVSKGKKTYMTMIQGKVGLGLGAKETREVLVFTEKSAFDSFVNSGWTADANATAAAKASDKGVGITGAKQVAKGVYVYQFTENGLVAEATVAGSKYSVDKELNTK